MDTETLSNRKPARKMVDVPSEVHAALSAGLVSTKNLTEWLSLDRQRLLATVCDELGFKLSDSLNDLWTETLLNQSALKQSFAIGKWLSSRCKVGDVLWRHLNTHKSDVVREWSAIIIGFSENMTFARKLAWVKPIADDENAGLREIAWMALRADVALDPEASIRCLEPWTGSRNERVRRFASEITRPCGVWTSHIPLLKEKPALATSILVPLKEDESKYVRDSVGNWLNDASKSSPEWVRAITTEWLASTSSPYTKAIVKRGLRTLAKKSFA